MYFWDLLFTTDDNFFKNQYLVVLFQKYKLFYTSASFYDLQYWCVFQ